MKNTLIVGAFPCCGKTYMSQSCTSYTCLDSDYSSFCDLEDATDKYVERIKDNIGKYDFIFISYHLEVFRRLNEEGIPFVYVSPNNTKEIGHNKRYTIKAEWFGRFVLRDNSHISNLVDFIDTYITDIPSGVRFLSEMYEELTSIESIERLGASSYFLLDQGQFLSDILIDLINLKDS